MTKYTTRPRGARLGHEELADSIQGGFNPRARVGRDSITERDYSLIWRFNPRARVGRDGGEVISGDCTIAFQSTRPRGARLVYNIRSEYLGWVSIHAPAWGATDKIFAAFLQVYGFNPRARVGRDLMSTSGCWILPMFQSTRPRGARPNTRIVVDKPIIVSIHAPAWGATRLAQDSQSDKEVSIHAPAWGATCVSLSHLP